MGHDFGLLFGCGLIALQWHARQLLHENVRRSDRIRAGFGRVHKGLWSRHARPFQELQGRDLASEDMDLYRFRRKQRIVEADVRQPDRAVLELHVDMAVLAARLVSNRLEIGLSVFIALESRHRVIQAIVSLASS